MLEMEILSQCRESTLEDFKPSPMNHGEGSILGQPVPVEYNRLTVSETVSIDEPAGGYMEILEYRNLARGHLMALEDKKCHRRLFGDDDARHHREAEGMRDSGIV